MRQGDSDWATAELMTLSSLCVRGNTAQVVVICESGLTIIELELKLVVS